MPTERQAAFAAELARRRSGAGLSLGRLSDATHVNRSYLYRVETGDRWPTEPVVRQLDSALRVGGALIRLWENAEAERQESIANARTVARSVRDSWAIDALLDDAPIGEAVTSAEAMVAALAVDYLTHPPGPMLRAALEARRAVVRELRRAPSTGQRLDLVRAAGYLSGVLSYAALDLGHSDAAREHAATAQRCANYAGDRELAAWVRGTQSLIARFDKDYRTALALAYDGLRIAGGGTSTPRLLAGVAQSAANLGDRVTAHRALNDAEEAINQAGADAVPGLFTFTRTKLQYYAGSALMWLPQKADLLRAARSAEAAIHHWRIGDPTQQSLDDEALAHVYAATAYVQLRDIDAASHALTPVLTLPETRRISWLRRRIGEITVLLDQPVFTGSQAAAELRSAAAAF